MPFIRFHPRFKSKGFHELLWAEGGSFHCLPNDIYIISERDLAMLDEKGIKYELLGRGVLRLSDVDGKKEEQKTKPKRKKAVVRR